jgi:hypothetical protein
MKAFAATALVSISILAACGGDGAKPVDDQRNIACPAIAEAAVVVQFVEVSGGAPAFVIASGTLTDGAYTEKMVGGTTANQLVSSLAGGFDRPGIYNVAVTAARTSTSPEQPFTFTNVEVTRKASGCGLNTKTLTAQIK